MRCGPFSAPARRLVLPLLAGLLALLPPASCAVEEPPPAIVAELGVPFSLVPGQTAVVQDSGLDVTLESSHGPPPGCHDCPSRAVLVASAGAEAERLSFALSPMMPSEALERARTRLALGHLFTVVRIEESLLTLLVEVRQP